jgi:4-amino-4-deoxy-L-arabinose transferase-like glycosyltransferase
MATMTLAAGDRQPIAWRGLGLMSLAYAVLLVAVSVGYGFHRDEFYFIAIGGHPAFGYVDQPPLVPLLAHALDVLGGGSLVVLRLPSALAGAAIVLVTGLIAREFGAARGAQLLAAGAMAVSAVLAAASHLMSTTIYDLLAWTVLSWLIVRALRDGGTSWLLAGIAAGLGLEIKTLIAFLLFALTVGVLLAGPRELLRERWLWAGAGIALVLWLPNLMWQASNDWPQLQLSTAIAQGQSGSSQPRWAFLPYQLLLVSPVLAPVWITGGIRLWRDAALRTWRCIPVAWAVLAVVFLATGGKPYYLAGLFPALLAAGAAPVLGWALSTARSRVLGAALAVSLAVSVVLFLPLVPTADLMNTPIVAVNYDAGETVGWAQFNATVARVYDRQPAETIVLAANYGEAGSLLHDTDLRAYSGQNSMWDLGPPPPDTRVAVAVGYTEGTLRGWFADVHQVATIDNGIGVDNDEQGSAVYVCRSPRLPWTQLWPHIRHLG